MIVQSRFLDGHRQRVVVPLIRTARYGAVNRRHAARVECLGEALWFDPTLVQSLPASRLGPVLANLDAQGDGIVAAIDAMTSRG